jgi:hypothetical protein
MEYLLKEAVLGLKLHSPYSHQRSFIFFVQQTVVTGIVVFWFDLWKQTLINQILTVIKVL